MFDAIESYISLACGFVHSLNVAPCHAMDAARAFLVPECPLSAAFVKGASDSPNKAAALAVLLLEIRKDAVIADSQWGAAVEGILEVDVASALVLVQGLLDSTSRGSHTGRLLHWLGLFFPAFTNSFHLLSSPWCRLAVLLPCHQNVTYGPDDVQEVLSERAGGAWWQAGKLAVGAAFIRAFVRNGVGQELETKALRALLEADSDVATVALRHYLFRMLVYHCQTEDLSGWQALVEALGDWAQPFVAPPLNELNKEMQLRFSAVTGYQTALDEVADAQCTEDCPKWYKALIHTLSLPGSGLPPEWAVLRTSLGAHRRSQEATARRRLQGGERVRRALLRCPCMCAFVCAKS